MLLINPHTGKLVDVAEAFVDQLSRAGFKKQEPEVVAPAKVAAPPVKRTPRKPRS